MNSKVDWEACLSTSKGGLDATTGPLPSDDQRIVATNFSPAGQAFLFATHTATCSSSCSYFVLLPRRPLPSPPPRYAQGRGSRYRAASPIPSSYAQKNRVQVWAAGGIGAHEFSAPDASPSTLRQNFEGRNPNGSYFSRTASSSPTETHTLHQRALHTARSTPQGGGDHLLITDDRRLTSDHCQLATAY